MPGRFDPYHKWLGIPAHEQPANYYRLLGLELFENDSDAIESAVERLTKYVREVATGEQREHAKTVLDELSAAKRCLLIAERKQAYDAGLRAGRSATPQTMPAQPAPRMANPVAVQVTPVESKTRAAAPQATSRKPPRSLKVIAATVALLGVGVLGFLFLRGGTAPKEQVADTPEAARASNISKQKDVAPQTAAAAGREMPAQEEVQRSVPKEEEPAAASTLPEFVSQAALLDQTGENGAPQAEPIDTKSLPVIESESSPEPQTAEDAKPDLELSADREIAEAAERGGLLREVWTNVTGNKVEEFLEFVAEHPEPNQTETIDQFAPPEDFDDQYGQRLRGYLHPPATGSYEFSIRANAEGWLYISTDALPENKRRVEPETKIEFEAGQAYYVEAFHKESSGRDYLSIGWKLPDGTEEKPIPGERLSVHYRIAPRHEAEFVVLTPQSAESSTGTKLDVMDEGVIAATGTASDSETYRLTFEPEMETITALRLEALPDDSLPASGPGRGLGGRFALAELSFVAAGSAAPDTAKPLSFASVVDDAGRDLRRVVDGDEKTVWRGSGRGEQAAVTLVVRDPTRLTGGWTLKVDVEQREALGRFRLLATSAPNPRAAPRPSVPGGGGGLFSLCVNLGGDDFTTPDGVRWRASKFFDNETFGHEGGRGVSEDLIANKVQATAQRGIAAFRAIVPEGTYEVTLYFCEYWSTTPSSRRFAMAAEQRIVAANFDLFQAAGGIAKPVVYPIRNVAVKDGRLDIEFRESSAGASTILNAIRIQQVR